MEVFWGGTWFIPGCCSVWVCGCVSMWLSLPPQPSHPAPSASKKPVCPCELNTKPNEHKTPSSSNWQIRLLGRKCLCAPVQIDLEWVHLAALGWQGVQSDSSFTLQINRHQIKFNNHGKHITHIHFLIFNQNMRFITVWLMINSSF